MKRTLALLLVLLTCLSLFACADQTDPDNTKTTSASDDVTTEAPVTEPPAEPVTVIENGVTEYTIIRPEDGGDAVVLAAGNLRSALSDSTGAKVGINTDWHKKDAPPPERAKEIVVGHCDRPGTEKIVKQLRERDFAIVYDNERIYIVGGCDDATARGAEYFKENYINADTKAVTVMNDLLYINKYDYRLGSVSVNGVSIMDYKIVIPDKCDILTESAAMNLSDYFYYNGGIKLETITDAQAKTDYEILIGDTNRPESDKAVATALTDTQYVLAGTASSIVMYGKSYMVGGAVSDFINNYAVSSKPNEDVNVTTLPTEYTAKTFTFAKAENALLLIGDGMGFQHIEAAKEAGLGTFTAEALPNKGEAKTYSQSVTLNKAKYTDSAASATALATGFKTINSYLGLDSSGRSVQNIRELAQSVGACTAVLTTDLITGATPGGFLVHINDRDLTAKIQSQIDTLNKNKTVDFAVGLKDSDKIIDEARFELWAISDGGSQFFAMIEEAYIDKYSHSNALDDTMKRVIRYNSIIAYCIEFTLCHPNTNLIITADHETGGIKFNKNKNEFIYTVTTHTNINVPVFALGDGTEYFNKTTVENTDIAKYMAKIYGATSFGG